MKSLKPKIELFNASDNPYSDVGFTRGTYGMVTKDVHFMLINLFVTEVTGFISIGHKQLPDLLMNLKNY